MRKSLVRAKMEHDKFLKSVGYTGNKRSYSVSYRLPNTTTANAAIPSLSQIPTGGGFKKSIDDYKWKFGRQETEDTIKEIEAKKRRIAPIYSKGPAQYMTDATDLKTLGRKV